MERDPWKTILLHDIEKNHVTSSMWAMIHFNTRNYIYVYMHIYGPQHVKNSYVWKVKLCENFLLFCIYLYILNF